MPTLPFNEGFEWSEAWESIRFLLNKIDPHHAGVVINKEEKISLFSKRWVSWRTPNVSMYQLKWSLSSPRSFWKWQSMHFFINVSFTNFLPRRDTWKPKHHIFFCFNNLRPLKFKWPYLRCHNVDSSTFSHFKAYFCPSDIIKGKTLLGAILIVVISYPLFLSMIVHLSSSKFNLYSLFELISQH